MDKSIAEASSRIEGEKARLLIVARDAESALPAVTRAAAEGFLVHIARNPLSALADVVEGGGVKVFDAVVTEVDFEFMGGLEAVTRMREIPHAAHMTVIVVRGNGGRSAAANRQSQIRAGGIVSSPLSIGSSQAFEQLAMRAGANFLVESFAEIR